MAMGICKSDFSSRSSLASGPPTASSLRLRCNACKKNVNEICVFLKEPLRNGYAKLYFGGIKDDLEHAGLCAVDSPVLFSPYLNLVKEICSEGKCKSDSKKVR
jgi:hypothetical protein